MPRGTPDTQVEMVGDMAVIITGAEPLPGAVGASVARARELDLDALQPRAP